jgi:hypothetical protein
MTTRRSATTDDGATTRHLRPPGRSDSPTPLRRVGAPGAGIKALLKKHATTRTGAYPEFKPDETERVVQMIDDDMIAGYYFHWVEEADGRKSFLCLANPSEDNFIGGDGERGCPLCECDKITKAPQFRAIFNVVELSDWDKKHPEVAVLETGVTLAGLIADAAESARSGPINRDDIAFAVKRTSSGEGVKRKYTFQFTPIKTRDLVEDYGVQALTDEQRADLLTRRYDAVIVKRDTFEDLANLVDDLYG